MRVGQRFLKNPEDGPLYFIGKTIDRSRNSNSALDSGSEREPFDEGLHGLFQPKAVEFRRMQQIGEDAYFCLRFAQRRLDFFVSLASSIRIACPRLQPHEIDTRCRQVLRCEIVKFCGDPPPFILLE